MIEVQKISFHFDGGPAVFQNLSFTVKNNEIISIVGPSGVGKSTLLKCLAGKLQISKGIIRVDNDRLLGPQEKLVAGHDEIAIVDQSFELDPHFSVGENISNRLLHLTANDRRAFTNELLSVFGLMELRDQASKHISGGEKQRLSMACALAKEPRYLLLDEPFSNLDVHLKRKIGRYLRELQQLRSMSVVLVTHEGGDALAWSDRILFLKNNHSFQRYTSESAYKKPKTLYEGRFFGELNSVYIDDKQHLFRPHQYTLSHDPDKVAIQLNFVKADFHGHYYANYFKLANGKEVVLYADKIMESTTQVYV